MKSIEEFKVKNTSGKVLTMQNVGKGRTYLDFGSTKLPRDFVGYRIKDTDNIAEPQKDGTFKIKGTSDTYSRI
ncbi:MULTISPECIES: hypothetical protein [Oxalobacteraceae]|uniref:Uncharacterized protein n=1 Tax=Herminiimonas contaminans TaxID=1111140 RepID=A0ABS0EP53_9BURK|nr:MULTISPECIES: hypothetical protein [Oxalobacteraceae]MBF8176635.1 hypothetical protein [Herminiimonas contaminans]